MSEPNVHSLDCADYQPRDLGPLIHAYQARHVVVHLYMPGEGQGPDYSRDQINSTRDNGASAGGYTYPYTPYDDADRMLTNMLELCESVGLQLPAAWVDTEYVSQKWPGPDEAWLDRWFDLCDSVQTISGPYCNPDWLSSRPWMQKYGRQGRPLWLAHHGVPADRTIYPAPAGWTEIAALQWQIAPAQGGLGPVDRNVFDERWTQYLEPDQPVDPCAELLAENERLRTGIDDAIAALTQLKGG